MKPFDAKRRAELLRRLCVLFSRNGLPFRAQPDGADGFEVHLGLDLASPTVTVRLFGEQGYVTARLNGGTRPSQTRRFPFHEWSSWINESAFDAALSGWRRDYTLRTDPTASHWMRLMFGGAR